MQVSSVTGSCQSVFMFKSECGFRQLLVAVSLCSGLVTYCGVCVLWGGGICLPM